METKSCLSLLLLLLLGLSQARRRRGRETESVEEIEVDDVDISSVILNTNNRSSEMLIEGDIVVPRTRNAMSCWSDWCRWPKDPTTGHVTIPYYLTDDFDSYETGLIERAFKSFHSKTCIRFVPYTNQRDYLYVEDGDGCWSNLGRQGGGQILSLNRWGCIKFGVVQHEALHALSFQHEQTRSDRDQYVRINWDNIDPSKAFNFHKQQTVNLDTPYDYSSIMHYGRKAFALNWGKDSITPIPDANVNIGQRTSLSKIDILRINRLYEC